jgi:hypothetical protein
MKTTLLRVFAAIVLLLPALQQPANAQVDREMLMNVMRALAVEADDRAQTASRADAARQVLREMILQLQTGTPNPQWYGRDLWMTMAMQTGNTGVYPQLRLLGPVTDVQLTGQTQLPAGILYAMAARHQNGQSNWLVGVNNLSRRIEYATFEVANAGQTLATPSAPRQQPTPSQQPARSSPDPQPLPAGGEASAACKKFPNLC